MRSLPRSPASMRRILTMARSSSASCGRYDLYRYDARGTAAAHHPAAPAAAPTATSQPLTPDTPTATPQPATRAATPPVTTPTATPPPSSPGSRRRRQRHRLPRAAGRPLAQASTPTATTAPIAAPRPAPATAPAASAGPAPMPAAPTAAAARPGNGTPARLAAATPAPAPAGPSPPPRREGRRRAAPASRPARSRAAAGPSEPMRTSPAPAPCHRPDSVRRAGVDAGQPPAAADRRQPRPAPQRLGISSNIPRSVTERLHHHGQGAARCARSRSTAMLPATAASAGSCWPPATGCSARLSHATRRCTARSSARSIPSGTIYRTKSAALEQCADDLVELARDGLPDRPDRAGETCPFAIWPRSSRRSAGAACSSCTTRPPWSSRTRWLA